MATHASKTAELFQADTAGLLTDWLGELKSAGGDSRISDAQLRTQAEELLKALATAAAEGTDVTTAGWLPVRDLLDEMSHSRAAQGFNSQETASFIFSLKRPLFAPDARPTGQRPAGLGR